MKSYTRSDWTLLVLVVMVSYAFGQVITPFLTDLLVALILVNVFWKLFNRIQDELKNKILSALSTMLLIVLIVIIPVFIAIYLIAIQALSLFFSVQENWPAIQEAISQFDGSDLVQRFPFLEDIIPLISELELDRRLIEAIPQLVDQLTNIIQGLFANIYNVIFHSIIMLVILFYFLVDGERIYQKIKQVVPLKNEIFDLLIANSKIVINSTVIGNILIAVIYGVLGAIFFLLMGIPSPFFWAVIIFFLSILPLIGAYIVYLGAGLIYILLGAFIQAGIILAFGIISAQIIENIVRPKLVGSTSGMNAGLVLVSTLGGLFWLGPIGLIIGPLIGAIFIAVWDIFGQRNKEEVTP